MGVWSRHPERSRRANGDAVPLYCVFALTGVGTAVLGATLPMTRMHWQLTDGSAGGMFLVFFLASSLGSLVPRRNTSAEVAGGGTMVAVACMALGVTQGGAVFAEVAAFGLGLGFTISTVTRVRLLCAETATARVREVNRMNLVWGLGAFLCPAAANGMIRHGGVKAMFFSLAAAFGIFAGWIVTGTLGKTDCGPAAAHPDKHPLQSLPWMVAVAAFLVVGLESSCGSWLATYAHRVGTGWAPVEATTLFWLGLLASRALCSTLWMQRFSVRQVLLGFLACAAAGCAGLLASAKEAWVLQAALLLGIGVGPVFPILLAMVLPQVQGNVILVIAGAGSAVLPWLTGLLSQRFGSLRVGLAAPVATGALLLAMGPGLAGTLEGLGGAPRETRPMEPMEIARRGH